MTPNKDIYFQISTTDIAEAPTACVSCVAGRQAQSALKERVIQAVQRSGGEITRTQLARSLHLKPAVMNELVQTLKVDGYIQEKTIRQSGKPKTMYSLSCEN